MIVFLLILCLLLVTWAVFATIYMVRFAQIILLLEKDFSEATNVLQSTHDTLDEFANMQLYYDSPEVQKAITESMDGIKAAKMAVAGLVGKFTQRSKQKYIEEIEEPAPEGELRRNDGR